MRWLRALVSLAASGCAAPSLELSGAGGVGYNAGDGNQASSLQHNADTFSELSGSINLNQVWVNERPRKFDVGLGYHARIFSGDAVAHGPQIRLDVTPLQWRVGTSSFVQLSLRSQMRVPLGDSAIQPGIYLAADLIEVRRKVIHGDRGSSGHGHFGVGLYVGVDHAFHWNGSRDYWTVSGGLALRIPSFWGIPE